MQSIYGFLGRRSLLDHRLRDGLVAQAILAEAHGIRLYRACGGVVAYLGPGSLSERCLFIIGGFIMWILLIIVIATSIWVGVDASTIGVKKGQMKGLLDMGPVGWTFTCLLFWIIGFPCYLAKRNEYKEINQK